MSNRVFKMVLWLIVAWFTMVTVHELGHVVCGLLAGGRVKSVDLLPWHLPQSSMEPDPIPLLTLWGGPILGALVPDLFAVLLRQDRAWFVAYFCILANGAYLATAWLTGDRFLDTARLLEEGTPPITIAIFCLVTIVIGYMGFRRHAGRLLSGRVEPQLASTLKPSDTQTNV